MPDLSNISDTDLQNELRRREDIRVQKLYDEARAENDLFIKAIKCLDKKVLDVLMPHETDECKDDNPWLNGDFETNMAGGPRCNRCALNIALRDGLPDDLRPVGLSFEVRGLPHETDKNGNWK